MFAAFALNSLINHDFHLSSQRQINAKISELVIMQTDWYELVCVACKLYVYVLGDVLGYSVV